MGGRRRRTRARPADAPRGRDAAGRERPRWRTAIDAWGGIPVIAAVVGAIVIVAAMLLVGGPGDEPYEPVERTAVDGRVHGAPDAPVRLIEFADFQCPVCQRYNETIAPELAERYVDSGVVKVEFRHLAFLGPDSQRAAEASECALDQGRFWDYHDILFLRQGRENSGAYSTGRLKDFARDLREAFPEFDVNEFDRCLESRRKRGLVEEMTQQARDAGINQTPTVLINGQLVPGLQDLSVYEAAIERARESAERR